MNGDRSSRSAMLEQLRQKRQRGEKNKYEVELAGTEDVEDYDPRDSAQQIPNKRSRTSVPCKKLSDFSGFGPNAENIGPDGHNNKTDDNSVIDNHTKSEATLDDSASKQLRIYCMDIYEDAFKKPGDIYLIGKTKNDTSGDYVTACIRIRGINRRFYVLPRKLRIDPISKQETGLAATVEDVTEELSSELKRMRIKDFTISKQQISKKHSVSADVPSTADYLELRYPFNQPALPTNFSGSTFSHVFGATSTGMEIFLLECRLRLPCWIELKNTGKSAAPFSWCPFEAELNHFDPLCVRSLSDTGLALPPMNLLSICVKTMPNSETGQKEIIAIGMSFLSPYFLDKEKQDESKWRNVCVVRKGAEQAHLYDFKMKLTKEGLTKVRVEENERALLSCVLAEIQKFNPDIIAGHDLWDFELPTLISRVSDKLSPQLQRLGWLRRSATANRSASRFDVHDIMAGRLICDLKVMAMEFILRSKSYDLTELAWQILNEKRLEIAEEAVPTVYNSSENLLNFTKMTITDTALCWRLIAKLCCLQLTSEITRIVGGVWSKTLAGGRAERTEFLLLHAFESAGYIAPDKQKLKKGFMKEKEEIEEDDEQAGGLTAKRKQSYVGGLVLEPKKGLYDNYVLLLDFNSLYPSIIMEYNVCFTTIDQHKWMDGREMAQIPDLPASGLEPGILPNEVRKLVESRKAVKQLMKDRKVTPERYQEYNIRQQALKITANSMYGCLGFSNSRFYAKPLAALITSQGREILMDTKCLVEKFHLQVIYGDTDSIMINTNCDNLEEVLSLGRKIKSEVNKKYRQLELDIDGVYKKLLLYKKKKYAGLMVDLSTGVVNQGEMKLKREMKGLDIVRRDCPPVAVEAGCHVLDCLLSDCEKNESLERIYSYLSDLAENMRNGTISVEKYEVSKQLSKPPEQYGEKKLPHVAVALRLNANGRHLKQGDVVPYVICEDGTAENAMQRAYHRVEMEANQELKIDVAYYLSQQVHPVVTRLLEPLSVPGADAVKVAECLGLDTKGYKRHVSSLVASKDNIAPMEDYAGCAPFAFKCAECKTENNITGVFVDEGNGFRASLQRCSSTSCSGAPWRQRAALTNQLGVLIRRFVKMHYQNWFVCEDCGLRTRFVAEPAESGEKALCPSCQQIGLHQEYSAQNLYSQLSYFQHIFDWDAATAERTSKGNISNDVRSIYDELKRIVDAAVSRNAYAQVDLGELFQSLM